MNRPAERSDPRPEENGPEPARRPFAREAYLFVFEALQKVQDDLVAAPERLTTRSDALPGRHITAAELCVGFRELAAAQFGGMARTVLRQWGVRNTEDVGRIVFELVERGELCKCDGDRPEDFAGLFDFDTAFATAFDADLNAVTLAAAR
ncbi:Minf_1886 family protein [Alienimonas californiensis]|uniref:Uncharacterized protein n=1 Tax=Alienimonas californiensis TaxID=2527989 RepID=A0A517P8A5_9PLAN|nr:Minf_1886 family protein [Alienimonas californiensis]QDT15609.1 hypothetical protein CA12_16940 [Alienimonas californiensis]